MIFYMDFVFHVFTGTVPVGRPISKGPKTLRRRRGAWKPLIQGNILLEMLMNEKGVVFTQHILQMTLNQQNLVQMNQE